MGRFNYWIAAGFLAALPIVVHAVPVEDAIKARHAYKQLIVYNARELFAVAKGDVPYDAAVARSLALNLQSLTHLNNATLWPRGSHKAANPGETRALQTVWQSDSFRQHHRDFQSATRDLADIAGTGLDPFRSKIAVLEHACRACHQSFRAHDF